MTGNGGPAIWKLDRFATHDGPGIRTTLYFKGCPLRCLWCSNPEGQRGATEIALAVAKCTGCDRCYDLCPVGALRPEEGRAALDFGKCTSCGECLPACQPGALFAYKKSYSLPDVMAVIKRDRHVYRKSGGGITCTGGEPFMQAEFLMRLLTACRHEGIHTAIESSGHAEPAQFREALDKIDWLFLDLKHVDGAQHRRLTGLDNSVILENLKTASSVFAETERVLAIRQVVVPGFNDGNNIRALAELAVGLPRVDLIELLPYHEYGRPKYETLGRKYPLEDLEPPSESSMLEYKRVVESYGLTCKIAES